MPETSDTLRPGERVGNYQILAMAGAGGMGVVYKALDLKLERTVALKFLPAEVYANEKDRERFLKEARTASSLDHTNIGVIHGVEETGDGRAFIVMAFYDGESLAQKIRRGPLKIRDAGEIAMQIAKGLEAAHARNIVHRDVKPSNILITPQGVVKIVDFGLARVITSASMTQTGGTAGTVGYMSPEQSLGKPIDVRTDVWALGVVLDEMLTGQNPFWRDNVPSTVVAILNEAPRPMEGVPPELQQIVYRALSKEPAYRYQNCTELRGDLENVRGILTPSSAIDLAAPTVSIKSGQFQKYLSHASQSAWIPASQRKSRAWRWWLAAGIAALVIIAVLAVPSVRNRLSRGLFAPTEEHVAVLPFDNIGNDPANEALAEGLMDTLTGKLSDLDVGGKSLWVVPSREVRRSKISDPAAALRTWGATKVVQGSIARNGQDVQLTVDLIDSQDLRQLGSATFEDRAGDIATLQDEAVAKLAKLMHINVSADMLRSSNGSANPAAYESYLKGLGYIQRYDTPGNLDRAKLQASRQRVFALLHDKYPIDAVILPSVAGREAPFSSGKAHWDGVSEPVTTKKHGLGALLDRDSDYLGYIDAISLELRIADGDDTTLFEDSGGIQVIEQVAGGRQIAVPQAELFADAAKNAQAVEAAFRELASAPQ